MTSPSKATPAPELDAQLAVALSAHGDAAALVRDAMRWRLIEPYLVTESAEVGGTRERGTIVRLRWPLCVVGLVRGGAGAVCDAIAAARRLSERLRRETDQAVPHA